MKRKGVKQVLKKLGIIYRKFRRVKNKAIKPVEKRLILKQKAMSEIVRNDFKRLIGGKNEIRK